MNESTMKVVDWGLETPTLTTDQGTIEGPTEYYLIVARSEDGHCKVNVSADTYNTFINYAQRDS